MTSGVQIPEYLELGDEIAVPDASRNQAKQSISGMHGVSYTDVRVRRQWMKPCDCDGCQEGNCHLVHDYDSYWIPCAKTDDGAFAWWVG